MLLIKNINIVDVEKDKIKVSDLLIEEDKILKVAPSIDIKDPELAIDEDTLLIDGQADGKGNGLYAAPGLVDVHVHFRDPGFTHKETVESGCMAAKAGGFTTVVCMANTKPVADNIETVEYVMNKGKACGVNVYQAGAITKDLKGEEITDFEALRKAGAPGFTDDGIPIKDAELVRQAMELSAKMQVPLSFHEEDPAFIENNGVNHGKASEYYGIGGSDRKAEISLIDRDLKLAIETGAIINVQHISSKEGVELVRQAVSKDKAGIRHIHAEACPHHFTLTEEAVIEHGTLAKMNPPLRTEEDRQAIIQGLKDNTIDIIATDHAPHSQEEKAKPITEAPSGIIGLETSLALGITSLVAPGHLSLTQLIKKMTVNPARMYGLDAGVLSEQKRADIVIFDPNEEWIFTEEDIKSKACNTPFLGMKLKGRVVATICGGEIYMA